MAHRLSQSDRKKITLALAHLAIFLEDAEHEADLRRLAAKLGGAAFFDEITAYEAKRRQRASLRFLAI
jgi:hypothetical protein